MWTTPGKLSLTQECTGMKCTIYWPGLTVHGRDKDGSRRWEAEKGGGKKQNHIPICKTDRLKNSFSV